MRKGTYLAVEVLDVENDLRASAVAKNAVL